MVATVLILPRELKENPLVQVTIVQLDRFVFPMISFDRAYSTSEGKTVVVLRGEDVQVSLSIEEVKSIMQTAIAQSLRSY